MFISGSGLFNGRILLKLSQENRPSINCSKMLAQLEVFILDEFVAILMLISGKAEYCKV